MKPAPDCVPCLMKRILFQARLLNNGSEERAMRSAVKAYAAGIDTDTNSAKLSTKAHSAAYGEMGVPDPYLELKISADKVAERYVGRFGDMVSSSDDPVHTAIHISIIGNIMDFGSGISIDDPGEFDKLADGLLAQGIDFDDSARLVDEIGKVSTVVYIFDNCGESVFDILLIRELKRMGKRVVGVVRGKPILNDVTSEDAIRVGLDKELDLMLDTGGFSVGLDMDVAGEDLKREMSRDSVIIAKGMANYESLSDIRLNVPLAHLLRAKCRPVAEGLGVPVGSNVVRLVMPI